MTDEEKRQKVKRIIECLKELAELEEKEKVTCPVSSFVIKTQQIQE